ncbi:FtsX-like permease family protein [Glaciihabitans sp. UYNi722]|uniref:ABC transporter permease n=1 Tax=Glaciihabitans sp. UYNi722 TaxID=3156344 RepID=UPI0033931C18
MKRSLSDHVPSVLVATLSAAFGVSLLEITSVLATVISADNVTGSSTTVGLLLSIVAIVFIVIAVYVGAIVTSNTFSTIIAGRTRTIALMRLIGSSAADQRRSVAREGFMVGVVGAILGAIVGTLVTMALVVISVSSGFIPMLGYSYLQPVLFLPIITVVLTTWLASWIGSRRVLQVSPMQATGVAIEMSREESGGRRGRNAVAIALFAVGIGFLVLGMLVGLVSPLGVLVGVVGGLLSFTGLVLGAHLVMPVALRLTGRMFGSSATARLAAENAVRYPERSSRTTIGLVIGVTLVTMFAVAVESYQQMIRVAQESQPEVYQGVDQTLSVTVIVFSVLMGFSALIAAVGMVNNLSMSILQRTRELGLLRALGFTARQVRSMILAESAQLTVAAVLVGLVLGIFYGWAGAQSLLGSIQGSPGFVLPVVPLALLGILVVAAAVLTLVASVAPSRRATRVAPVAALAVE